MPDLNENTDDDGVEIEVTIEDEEALETGAEEREASAELAASDEDDDAEPVGDEPSDEELNTYSRKVQKRIKRLTERFRREERDRAEALRISQMLLQENTQLKSRVQQLDTGYLQEYGTRLEVQEAAARQAFKEAYESNDTDSMLRAQEALQRVTLDKERHRLAKAQAENIARTAAQRPAQRPAEQQPAPQSRPVDPRAASWAERNPWFGSDPVRTAAAMYEHTKLVTQEGFDPMSDAYYNELDRRVNGKASAASQPGARPSGARVASAAASASRAQDQRRRTVKLTPSQVATAKGLGVPLAEYAKYVRPE